MAAEKLPVLLGSCGPTVPALSSPGSAVNHDPRLTLVADGLVRVSEACKILSIGKSKLYELMTKGDVPFVQLGSARRIPRRAVMELMAKRLVDSRAK